MLSQAKNSNLLVLVGLGNPGREYAHTRHNVGFLALDALFPHVDWRNDTIHQALIAKSEWGSQSVLLVKPQAFMNASGESVQALLAYYHLTPQNLVVIHDEADLPLGTIKRKEGGGHAGHNGIRSLIDRLGTDAFARIRFGIGRPPHPEMPLDAFVLQPFTASEQELLPNLFATIAPLAFSSPSKTASV